MAWSRWNAFDDAVPRSKPRSKPIEVSKASTPVERASKPRHLSWRWRPQRPTMPLTFGTCDLGMKPSGHATKLSMMGVFDLDMALALAISPGSMSFTIAATACAGHSCHAGHSHAGHSCHAGHSRRPFARQAIRVRLWFFDIGAISLDTAELRSPPIVCVARIALYLLLQSFHSQRYRAQIPSDVLRRLGQSDPSHFPRHIHRFSP
jgi:hypothetical protein